MSNKTITEKTKGLTKVDYNKLLKMTTNLSSNTAQSAVAPEDTNVTLQYKEDDDVSLVLQKKRKIADMFSDSKQTSTLLDLFTKRQKSIKDRKAAPGRNQVL